MTAKREEKFLAAKVLSLLTDPVWANVLGLTPPEIYHAAMLAAEGYRGRECLPEIDVSGLGDGLEKRKPKLRRPVPRSPSFFFG